MVHKIRFSLPFNRNPMKITQVFILIIGIFTFSLQNGHTQFRADSEPIFDRSGNSMRPAHNENTSFLGLQNFQMNHSYDMTVGSFGGDMYNRNTYTNTMHMMFNENLYGRVDLSMSHSPLGPNIMGQNNQTEFYVRNAELNYRFSENARIQLRFQQLPSGFGYGYYPYSHHRHRRTGYQDPFRIW